MQKGDFVKIRYVGRLETGEIFDLTDEETAKRENIYNPKIRYGAVPVIIGAGFVIKGLEKALEEMNVGEKRFIEIKPADAFGERDPKLVKIIPKKVLEQQNIEPKQGLILDFGNMKGRVQSVAGGRVRVDFNNPLAGKVLKYDLEIAEKIENNEEKVKAVGEFFGIDDLKAKLGEEAELQTKYKLPLEVKERMIYLVMKYVDTSVKSVRFVEIFERPTSLQ